MQKSIIDTATKMFLTLGFKSVTMDDVASKMGISKKTIYKYFENKELLIEACVNQVHFEIHSKIQHINSLEKNAVEENFLIREMFNDLFKTDGDSPVYQLKKHYPLIYEKVREREASQCQYFFKENILKGIEQGYYRSNINVDLVTEFYYLLIFGINETHQSEREINIIELEALIYHTCAIATDKGKKELLKQLEILNYKPNFYV